MYNYQYQQPPPMNVPPSVFSNYAQQAEQSRQPQVQQPHQMYSQPQQTYQSQYSQQPQQPQQPQRQPGVSCNCPFSRFLARVTGSEVQIKKKYVMLNVMIYPLIVLLCIFTFQFRLQATLILKLPPLVLSIIAAKRNCLFVLGSAFGYQVLSTVITFSFAFHGFYAFFMVVAVLIMEILSLFYAVQLAKTISARQNASANGSVPQIGPNEDNDDIANDFVNEESRLAPSTQPDYQAASQPVYPSVYPSQPDMAQAPQNNVDAQLLQKYSVQLGLLAEMNFEQNPQQRVRNAKMLEKYNGNIQAVVSDILAEGN